LLTIEVWNTICDHDMDKKVLYLQFSGYYTM